MAIIARLSMIAWGFTGAFVLNWVRDIGNWFKGNSDERPRANNIVLFGIIALVVYVILKVIRK